MREFERFFTKDLSSYKSRPDLSSRTEFGHREGDTVELIRGQNYLVTMVERKTRFLLVKQVPNKKAETVRNAILSDANRRRPRAHPWVSILEGQKILQ